jgi:hypothetical protein
VAAFDSSGQLSAPDPPAKDPRAITPGIPATLPINTNQAGADMDGMFAGMRAENERRQTRFPGSPGTATSEGWKMRLSA